MTSSSKSKNKKSLQKAPLSARSFRKNDGPALPSQLNAVFKKLFDMISEEAIVTDSSARIVYANRSAVKGLGKSGNSILGEKITKFFQEKISVKQWEEKYFQELKKARTPVSYVIKRRAGGKDEFRKIHAHTCYMNEQGHEFVLFAAKDLTDQLSVQRQLKQSEELHHLLSEQAKDGIVTLDLKGRIVYANPAAQWLVNIPLKKSKGKSFMNFVAKDSLSKAKQNFSRVKKGQAVVGDEFFLVTKDGKRLPVEVTSSPILKDGRVIQIHNIIRDMSRRRQLDDLMVETEKMRSLRDVISGTTQEIQYPLKAIKDACRNLVKKYEKRDFEYIGFKEFKDIMSTLSTLKSQAQYCFDTTERLLSLNKKKIGLKDNRCSLNAIVNDSIKQLGHELVVSGVKIRSRLGKKLPWAAIGSMEMSQIMMNILNNAIQSMPGGGEILLRTDYDKIGHRLTVECIDQGVGIPQEVLSRIYDPFFTTKQRGLEKNSGLGLSIVDSIVRAYHGTIKIKSTLRKGTAVTVHIPSVK